jgi:hypothetical protein
MKTVVIRTRVVSAPEHVAADIAVRISANETVVGVQHFAGSHTPGVLYVYTVRDKP